MKMMTVQPGVAVLLACDHQEGHLGVDPEIKNNPSNNYWSN